MTMMTTNLQRMKPTPMPMLQQLTYKVVALSSSTVVAQVKPFILPSQVQTLAVLPASPQIFL
jgi:hypothetical protein